MVSQNRVLPHSVPPASTFDAAKCSMVATVRARSTSRPTPATCASYSPLVTRTALPSTTANPKSVRV